MSHPFRVATNDCFNYWFIFQLLFRKIDYLINCLLYKMSEICEKMPITFSQSPKSHLQVPPFDQPTVPTWSHSRLQVTTRCHSVMWEAVTKCRCLTTLGWLFKTQTLFIYVINGKQNQQILIFEELEKANVWHFRLTWNTSSIFKINSDFNLNKK